MAMAKGTYVRTEEHKRLMSEKCREATLKKWRDPEWRKKMLKRLRSPEHRRKMSETLKGRKFSNKTLEKMRIAGRERWKNPLFERKMRAIYDSKEYRGKISKKTKLQWQNPEFRKLIQSLWANREWRTKQQAKMLHGLLKRPTSLEQQFTDICKRHNLPYKYVGDGRFFIGSKNPDFIHKAGKKIAIEVGNTYFPSHSRNYEQSRKNYFGKFGWQCFVFLTNGKRLNENNILSKLR